VNRIREAFVRSDISLMRILAAYAVVLIHLRGPQDPWNQVSHWAVPLFVMISGALLLERARTETLRHFYRRRVARIVPVLLAGNLIYLGLRLCQGGTVTAGYLAHALIFTGGVMAHLWFLEMILVLYLLAPAIGRLSRYLPAAWMTPLCLATLVIEWIVLYRNGYIWEVPPALRAVFYAPFFLLGYSLDRRGLSLKPLPVAVILAGGGIAIAWAAHVHTGGILGTLGTNFSPLIVALAVVLFGLCRNLGRRRWVRDSRILPVIAGTTLGIYVIHPALIDILRPLASSWWMHPATPPLLAVLIFALSTALILVWQLLAARGREALAGLSPENHARGNERVSDNRNRV
jgi:surface polysaccharide O-acyltransferase-like enzyme